MGILSKIEKAFKILLGVLIALPVGYIVLASIPFLIGLAVVGFAWLIYTMFNVDIDEPSGSED